MKQFIAVFSFGLLFALGLGVSGMTDANKVIGFLNLAGQWDPALAFVMVGAIGAHLALYKLILKRGSPLYGASFRFPRRTAIDKPLVIGASIFGIGWGLGGFCPGPGVVSSAGAGTAALVFTGAMVAGMVVFKLVHRRSPAPEGSPAAQN